MKISSHQQWAITYLTSHGYILEKTTPEIIQSNHWSEVSCFTTNQGIIYLKKTPPALFIESNIIKLLQEKFDAHTHPHAHVPVIIADNPKHHCFLMHDAGITLREFFKHGFHHDILIQALEHYTTIQITSIQDIQLFINMGVPDWRLEKIPALYQHLIEQEDLLIHDGLTQEQLKKLRLLKPTLESICKKLSSYKIPDILGHCDFQYNNILINPNTHQTTIIDLGEVAITYPFFSLHNALYCAKSYALTDEQYQALENACFTHWLAFESQENLLAIMSLMKIIWPIHSVLGEYRLMMSCEPNAFSDLKRQGRLKNNLSAFISNVEWANT